MNQQIIKRFLKNKSAVVGLIILGIFVFIAIFGDMIAPYDPTQINLGNTFSEPNSQHWLGTDNVGRDIFSRMLSGAKVSLTISIIGVSMGVFFGMFLGVIGGYFGKWLDSIVVGIIDVLLSFPGILLAIFIIAIFGTGLFNIMLAVGVFSIPTFARIIRSSILSSKQMDYIEATRALGSNDIRIIFKHIIPNSLSPIIVQSTLMLGRAILITSGLSFLGLGVQPPNPEWGAMLSSARVYLRSSPIASIAPGVAITLVVLSFSLVGDGLRDALDPKLKNL